MVVASELEPLLAAAFLTTVDRLREAYSLVVIEDAVASGKLDILIDNLARNPQAYAPLVVAVQTSATRAAIDALDRLPAKVRTRVIQPATSGDIPTKRPAASVGVVFDGYNPKAVAYVRDQSSKLIQGVSEAVRASVKQVVERGIKEGTGPAAMARDIKTFIGLTPRMQQAVTNYRTMLEAQDPEVLNRALRDARFDPTVLRSLKPGAPKLTAAQVDTQVERFRERSIAHRAEMIARTEAITALNTGQKAAWAQVVSDGGVADGDVRRFWHVARDERTCEICKPIPGMNPEGVGLDDYFKTPDGPVDGPTMHPHCRCTVFVEPFFR